MPFLSISSWYSKNLSKIAIECPSSLKIAPDSFFNLLSVSKANTLLWIFIKTSFWSDSSDLGLSGDKNRMLLFKRKVPLFRLLVLSNECHFFVLSRDKLNMMKLYSSSSTNTFPDKYILSLNKTHSCFTTPSLLSTLVFVLTQYFWFSKNFKASFSIVLSPR